MCSSRHLFLWCSLLGSVLLLAVAWTAVLGQTPTVDPIDITASYIIRRATEVRGTDIALGTPLAMATLPFTDAIPRATATLPFTDATPLGEPQGASATPEPTEIPLTDAEKEELQRRWVSEMEEAFGFSHPIFDYVASEQLRRLAYLGGDSRLRQSHTQVEIRSVDFEDSHYVVGIVVDYPDMIMLFQVKPDGEILLLNDKIQFHDNKIQFHNDVFLSSLGYLRFDDISYSFFSVGRGQGQSDFADRNGNGYPDLLFWGYSGGSCGLETLVLWELRPGGEVVDLTNYGWRYMEDLDGDGIMEFGTFVRAQGIGKIWQGVFCHNVGAVHWDKWDGIQYVDVTTTLDESVYPAIAEFWADETYQTGCLVPDDLMLNLLLDYEALGRLEEGWARLAPMLHWEVCPAQTLIDKGEAMGAFLTWVGEHLRDHPQD